MSGVAPNILPSTYTSALATLQLNLTRPEYGMSSMDRGTFWRGFTTTSSSKLVKPGLLASILCLPGRTGTGAGSGVLPRSFLSR
jgi:hypothetical protein